jgi:hypothetical protein
LRRIGSEAGTKVASATLIFPSSSRVATGATGVEVFGRKGGRALPFRNLKGFREYDAPT